MTADRMLALFTELGLAEHGIVEFETLADGEVRIREEDETGFIAWRGPAQQAIDRLADLLDRGATFSLIGIEDRITPRESWSVGGGQLLFWSAFPERVDTRQPDGE